LEHLQQGQAVMAREDFHDPEFDPTIDPMALDKEWLNQPNLYYTWAIKAADAGRKTDEAKAALELERAMLTRLITANPAEFGLLKSTDSVVSAAVLEQAEYKAALRGFNKAKHFQDVCNVVLKTLDHRKRALENLVELHGMNYFSAPTARGDAGEAMRTAEKRATRRAGVKANLEDLD